MGSKSSAWYFLEYIFYMATKEFNRLIFDRVFFLATTAVLHKVSHPAAPAHNTCAGNRYLCHCDHLLIITDKEYACIY